MKKRKRAVENETPDQAATRLAESAPTDWTKTERDTYWWGAYDALIEVALRVVKPAKKAKRKPTKPCKESSLLAWGSHLASKKAKRRAKR